MERRAFRPLAQLFRKILRCRSLYIGWREPGRLFPRNQFIQIIPVRPIRTEALFIEQPLGATTYADLVRVTLHPHRPAHLAMPAPTERHHDHSSQAGSHYANWPQPPGLPRFSALFRAFCHHSSKGTHKSQHRPDCSAGQTREVVPYFAFCSPLSPIPIRGTIGPLYQWTLRYMSEEHYPCPSGS